MGALWRLSWIRELALLPVLAVVIVIGSIVNPVFLNLSNLISLLQQSSELAVVSLGLALILISGKFDLSLESTFGLAPMVAAWLMSAASLGGSGLRLPAAVGILVVLAIGLGVGAFNAFMVVNLRLNAFMVTLAMLILLRGLSLGVTHGSTLYDLPPAFFALGSASWFGIPVALWFTVALFVLAGLFLRYSSLGRSVYAIGGNAEAARAAGIRIDRVHWFVFLAGSLLAAIGGLMLTGRQGAVTAAQGQNLIFSAFAAAVIGGISLNGGRGRILGVATGVLLLGVINNLLQISQVPVFWIDAAYGAMILIALLLAKFTGQGAE
jgi:simple sugar transport system permease protein